VLGREFWRERRAGRVARAAALIVLLAGLAAGPAQAQGGDFPRTVIDGTGAAVTIPARPPIVAAIGSHPALEQVVPAAELRQMDATTVPGSAAWAGIGLLVVPELYAAAYPALIAAARAAGVPVFLTVPITNLPGWRASIERFGQATGREVRASAAIRCLDLQLTIIQALVQGRPPVRALVLTPEGYTFGRGTLITDLLNAAGGMNAAAEAGFDDFRQVDDAAIRSLAPHVILLSPAWSAEGRAAFLTNPAYAAVPAVRAGRVFRLPFRPTLPRNPGTAVVALAILLHVG
jgi:iron complex transport system substrate-binding protein